jgi:PAS domain S-box-containing protein
MSNRLFMRLERARAEEALRESEERLQKAVSIDTAGVLFFNLNGHITHANKAFERMSGYTLEELLTMVHWEVLTPPEFREVTARVAGQLAERGETEPYEKQLFRKDGSRWWGLFAPTRIKGSGTDSECVEFIIDITDRKKTEQQLQEFNALLEQQVAARTQALKENKERFEAAINVSPVTLSILKSIRNEQQEIIDFHFDWVSKSVLKIAGKDLTGLRLAEQFPYLRQLGVFGKFVNTVENGAPTDCECLYNAEGYNLWIHWKAVQLEDGLFVSVEDITERKKAEAEITKNLTLLSQSEEVAKTGSWEYDIATGLFNWSEGMYRLFGLPAGSPVKPETYLDFVIEEDRPIAQKIISQLRERHEPVEETLRVQVNGQTLTLRVKAVVLRNADESPIKILGVDIDISEVKRLEKENLQMRLNQQKNLLLAILNAQEEERRRISESLHNGVGQILFATKLNLDQVARLVPSQAIKTTEKLLEDAIIETRRVSHELVPVILKDFGLREAIQDICNIYNQKSLQVHCRLEGLKERLESYLELAVYRISQELLNNVVKHAQATEATLHLSKRADHMILQVQDNGIGLTKEEIKTKGIGLRTIRDRVKLLNGTVSITSPKAGKGTLITIRIPVKI